MSGSVAPCFNADAGIYVWAWLVTAAWVMQVSSIPGVGLGIIHIIRLWLLRTAALQRQRTEEGPVRVSATTVAGRPRQQIGLMERTTGRLEVPLLL